MCDAAKDRRRDSSPPDRAAKTRPDAQGASPRVDPGRSEPAPSDVDGSQPTARTEPRVGPERDSRLRIVVVDDNRDWADSLAAMLQLLDYEVQVAYDGDMGVQAAAAFRPDVVLLDVGLPRLSGYDACRLIREQTWGKEMSLVAVTGWGQEEDLHRSVAAGFDHHLVKPVAPETLTALLEEIDRLRT